MQQQIIRDMKTFQYYDYYEKCPLAVAVENAVNDCGSLTKHLEKLNVIFVTPSIMESFFRACIAYWSETEYFDGRNRYAVLASRKIAEHFPEIKEGCEYYKENLLLNAYGFTMSAHRYLQNELFKVILEYYKEYAENTLPIYKWFDEMEFVYNGDYTELVPFRK